MGRRGGPGRFEWKHRSIEMEGFMIKKYLVEASRCGHDCVRSGSLFLSFDVEDLCDLAHTPTRFS